MQHISYISIGSNLGDRVLNCQTAISMLDKCCNVLKVSSFYETEPWGYEDNNQYINAVVKLKTSWYYRKLLSELKLIEKKMGRKEKSQNNVIYESRIIDLDILFFNNLVVNDLDIIIPHPKLYHRNYVLQPFSEIASGFICPLKKETISTILQLCHDKSQVDIYPH